MADTATDIFDQVAPSSSQGGGDVFDQITAAGPQAPVNPYADRNDLSNVPGAVPGMQTPQQAAGARPQDQPVAKEDIFDAVTGTGTAPASAAESAQDQRTAAGVGQFVHGTETPDQQGAALTNISHRTPQQSMQDVDLAVGSWVTGGYEAAAGLKDAATTPQTQPGVRGAEQAILPGANRAIRGAMTAGAPSFAAAGWVAPVQTALAYFSGVMAGKGAQAVAAKLNMTPEEQELANTIGTFIPLVFHQVTALRGGFSEQTARVPDPVTGGVKEVPVKTASVGGRGFGVGVGKGEDGSIYAAGRVGPFSARAKWGGSPEEAPASPTGPVKGQLGAGGGDPTANVGRPVAPPQDPITTLQNEKIQAITAVAAQAADTEAKADGITKGIPPPPPPSIPKPAGMDKGQLTQQAVENVGTAIHLLPPEQKAQGILESVGNLAKWIDEKKTIVGPDNKITTVDSPQAAQKAAVKIVNDEVERQGQKQDELAQTQQDQVAKQQQDAETARTEREESLEPKKEGETTKVDIPDTPLVRQARSILAGAPDNVPSAKLDQMLRDKVLLPTPVRKALVDDEVSKRAQRQETTAQEAMNGAPTPEGQKPEEIEKWVGGVKKGDEPFAHIQKGTTYKPRDVEGLSRTKVEGAKDASGIYYHDPEVSGADIRKAARAGTLEQLRQEWKNGKTEEGEIVSGSPAEASPAEVQTEQPQTKVTTEELPHDIAGAKPRYGYRHKNFELDFEDPRDLAAFTVGQKTPNKAHDRFVDYLRKNVGDDNAIRQRSETVKKAIKDLAKEADPEEGPLKVPSQQETKPEAKAAPIELSPDVADDIASKISQAQAEDPTVTASALLKSDKISQEIAGDLEKHGIIDGNVTANPLSPGTLTLTPAARARVADAMLGRVLDTPELQRDTPPFLKERLLGSVGSITALDRNDDGWNLRSPIQEAVRQFGQLHRGEATGERGPVVDALIRTLDKNPAEFRKAMSIFSTGADIGRSGDTSLGVQAPEPFEDFNLAFGTELTKQQFDSEIGNLRNQPTAQPATEAPAAEAPEEPKPLAKGDQVTYTTNGGKTRPGEIAFTDGRIARIKDAKTGTEITKKIADVQRVAIQSTPETEAVPTTAAQSEPEVTLVHWLSQHFDYGQGPRDYNGLKKIVAEFDGSEPTQLRMKEAQEAYEAALNRIASEVVEGKGTARSKFDQLVQLYENQPNLSIRTSTSITNQAYSTPMPLAFIADKFAGITRDTTVYEPTAGNGNLLIAAKPSKVIANEIEPNRIQNLLEARFSVTTNDASKWTPERKFDSVVANPPFGSLPAPVEFDGYHVAKLDHLIALKALSAMKDDGHAAVIVGAQKEPGELISTAKPFFNYLYSHYNVVADFELSGDMYSRQGAAWPVRVVAIDGRARSAKVVPQASAIERLTTWESVYDQASQHLGSNLEGQRRADIEPAGAVRGEGTGRGDLSVSAGAGASLADSGQSQEGAASVGGSVGSGQPGPIEHTGGVPTPRVGSSDNVVASDGDVAQSDRLAEDQPREKAVRRGTPQSDGHSSDALAEEGNQFQDAYTPLSEKKDVNILAPKAMVQPMQRAMETVSNQVGDLDQFVSDELGYSNVEEMQKAFMGLQVDTVAAAIQAISRGKGVIIGDQTGIGKGRQAAAIIRWAELHGHLPIFVTAKPNLFTDMYGDLTDIGSGNVVNPLLMNKDATITHPATGRKVFGNNGSMTPVFQRMLETGQLPEGRNALFTTYSQVNTANRQQLVLSKLAPRAVFILDESHKAGGDSNTGLFFRNITDRAKGAVYLSATYAKRPDNLPLYASKTDIGIAITDKDKIVSAIAAGGAPLQAVVSNQLAQAGQLFRRERSFKGISFPTFVAESRKSEHEKISDSVTEVLRGIVHADKLYHELDFKDIKEEVEGEGGSAMMGGNKASQTVNHMEFTSVVHNLTKQLLLGLKADDVSDMILQEIEDDKKPIIALENTMGSFLSHYASSNGLQDGAPLHNFTYSTVLQRALDRTRYYNETNAEGLKRRVEVPVARLSQTTQEAYEAAQSLIRSLHVNIPVSPIDWIRQRLENAGRRVAEITGRDLRVDYSREVPVLSKVPSIEKRDRVNTAQGFNNGGIDALIMNQAGSTGISLHASEKFNDQRTRTMYVVQPAADVNEFMQMLGRINRTGQTRLPEYKMFAVALPAETRPAMNLSKKMKSLNANTSSNTRSAVSVDSPDMMNKYGDQVVQAYLNENPAMAAALGMGVSDKEDDDEAGDDVARKATGRSALLPVKEQKEFMDAVTEAYTDYMKYLDDTGQNDLEPKTYDFDAKEKDIQRIYQGTDETSPFGQDAHYGEYSIKRQGKPFSAAEVKDMVKEGLDGAANDVERHRTLVGELDKQYQNFVAKHGNSPSTLERAAQTKQGTSNFMMTYRVGSGMRLEINGESYNGVITNIEGAKKPAGNPFAASAMKYTVAVNGPMRSIKVSGSELAKIAVMPLGPRANVDRLFQDINPDSRMIAKIITGNLLGAYGSLKGVKGRIISFTMADGTTKQGILMPAKFDPKENIENEYAARTPEGALATVKSFNGSHPVLLGSGGDVMVHNDSHGIIIKTKMSKAQGGKFFLDPDLRGTIEGGEFVSRNGLMVGNVKRGDELKALRIVMQKAALYATKSMIDRAREEDTKVRTGQPQQSTPQPQQSAPAQAQTSPTVQLDDRERAMLGKIRATWTNSENLLYDMGENDAEFRQYSDAIARLTRRGLVEQQQNAEWGTDFRRTPAGTSALKQKPSLTARLMSEEGSATIPPAVDAAGQYVAKAVPATWNELVKFAGASGMSAKKVGYEIAAALAPGALADNDSKDIMSHAVGEPALRMFQAGQLLDGVQKMFRGMTPSRHIEFVDRWQNGRSQPSADLQAAQDLMQSILEQQRERENEAANLGRDEDDKIELTQKANYFPNRYSKAPGKEALATEGEQIARIGMSRRPFGGNKAFTKKQSYTLKEAVEKGAVPLGNPVEMLQRRMQEGSKFVAERYSLYNFKDQGLMQFRRTGKKMPDDYVEINDRMAQVRRAVELSETDKNGNPRKAFVGTGTWVIQKDAGRLLNNYLSTDHIRGSEIGANLINLKNVTTEMRLALSPFHFGYITVENFASGLNLGLDKFYNQGIRDLSPAKLTEGLEDIGKAITQPYTAVKVGGQMLRYAKNPDQFLASPEGEKFARQYPDFPRLQTLLFHGGLRWGMADTYKSSWGDGFTEALKAGELGKSFVKAVPWLTHSLMKPLFEHYIPRSKWVFAVNMLAQKLSQYSQAIAAGSMTEETIAREVAATTDNRFGEFNWDSLWLNNTTKTAMQLTFRSATWKIGSWRGAVQAGQEQFTSKAFDDRIFDRIDDQEREFQWLRDKTRKLPQLGMNSGWLLSMGITVAVLGSVAEMLATHKTPWEWAEEDKKNGLPKWGSAALEAMHPRTGGLDQHGQPIRISFPTGLKDYEHGLSEPGRYLKGSMSDWLSNAWDTLANRDAFGNYVYNPNDPTIKEFMQGTVYNLRGDFMPMSTSNYARKTGSQDEASKLERATGLIGGAPKRLDESAALAKAISEEKPHDPYTPEQEEAYHLAQQNAPTHLQVLRAVREKNYTYLEKVMLHDLSYSQAKEIYEKYATPQEQQQLRPIMERKRTLEILKASRRR